MVTKTVRIVACDLCGLDGEDVQRYVLTSEDGRRTVDLHEKHESEVTLEKIKQLVPVRRGQNMKGQPVVTEAEVRKARKRTQAKKRAAAKKN